MGMSDTEIKLSAHRLEALREQLPPSARGGERELLRALLSKFPHELKKKATKFRNKMCQAEVCKKSYDWNFRELTAILSTYISSKSAAAEANTTEPDGAAATAAAAAAAAAARAGTVGTTRFRGCLNCGLDSHQARQCETPPCSICGLRFCFGIRKRGPKKGCLVKKILEGGKIEATDLGLNGHPLTESLIARINARAAELKADKTGEANTATQTTLDDDLYADGDSD